jgi:L-methionine (R)-S-oxide reductase
MEVAFTPDRLPSDKSARYTQVVSDYCAIVAGENSSIARYATAVSLLQQAFAPRFYWVGFYLVDSARERELVVGPYAGTLGCLRIAFDRGVCGAAARTGTTQLVADVHAFPGHIACDGLSRSEIAVPVRDTTGALAAVLDVDSTEIDAFDATDAYGLEALCAALLTRAQAARALWALPVGWRLRPSYAC